MRRAHAYRQGFFVPVVIGGLVLFGIYVSFLMFASSNELALTSKQIKQDRARVIAESAIELGRALIFQNDFERRWYKQEKLGAKRFGYKGSLSGTMGGGQFLLVGEDIANPATGAFQDWVATVTYNRIDLFAEGRYDDYKVIVYRSLYWHPEQKVWKWGTQEKIVSHPDGSTTTESVWVDFQMR